MYARSVGGQRVVLAMVQACEWIYIGGVGDGPKEWNYTAIRYSKSIAQQRGIMEKNVRQPSQWEMKESIKKRLQNGDGPVEESFVERRWGKQKRAWRGAGLSI